jgi:hypothetical protein
MTEFINSNISSKSLFLYGVIMYGLTAYFLRQHITLNLLCGVVISIVIIYILYQKEIDNNENIKNMHTIKSKYITPTPTYLTKYDDLTDFVFSIQDFYEYNPQAYENMVDSIDTFVEIYDTVLLNKELAGDYFSIADSYKLLALNALQSIIITIPSNKNLINKLNESMQTLEKILNNYIYIIYQKNNEYITEKGYFNNTKLIDLKISPYNKCNNTMINSYDYYI